MHKDQRTLVVGTTPDYVDWIRTSRPGQALFLTRPHLRHGATETPPLSNEEILEDMSDTATTLASLTTHLKRWGQTLSGVVAFDCESLLPAARLAKALGLTFPSPEAVCICRNKIATRRVWKHAGLPTPEMHALTGPCQASDCFAHTPAVLKPAFGSGSELVFYCTDAPSRRRAFQCIARGLSKRHADPLYAMRRPPSEACILGEAFAAGPEFSCDLLLSPQKAQIIRLTEKLRDPALPFGTAMAYLLQDRIPERLKRSELEALFTKAAHTLGLTSGIAMVDFILTEKGPLLLEMTPRPGGDCLPWLIRNALGIDTLTLALDAADGQCRIPTFRPPESPVAGLRLHATQKGRISGIVSAPLLSDPRVRALHLTKTLGDIINLPPEDYDSWVLGHVIFTPQNSHSVTEECINLKHRLKWVFETP
ncbi:ATP-grasp domain-containing protein [Desulfoluna butyratoxydans]|uniref:Atp-grasp domain n=1 Tax=Desulfoluna butyratoxydans TaxID=231438 RepID=A0A4U8YV26_9BACT|nr:ATP-grasp domain-containing protein [Desulfoluna butyratoxydans]VFQ45782.1 atp-grasp domain [Desulfoluna butyratoxydans]